MMEIGRAHQRFGILTQNRKNPPHQCQRFESFAGLLGMLVLGFGHVLGPDQTKAW